MRSSLLFSTMLICDFFGKENTETVWTFAFILFLVFLAMDIVKK